MKNVVPYLGWIVAAILLFILIGSKNNGSSGGANNSGASGAVKTESKSDNPFVGQWDRGGSDPIQINIFSDGTYSSTNSPGGTWKIENGVIHMRNTTENIEDFQASLKDGFLQVYSRDYPRWNGIYTKTR